MPPDGHVADVPVAGIVKTAVVLIGEPPFVCPPVIKTFPFAKRVAVCESRAVASAVVFDHAEVDVLNNCTLVVLVVVVALVLPPTTKTMLLKLELFWLLVVSRVAVWKRRAEAMVPVAAHEPTLLPVVGFV